MIDFIHWFDGIAHDIKAAWREWCFCRDMRKYGDPTKDYF